MRSCASREPALADRGGAHPQHHGSPAQATREGARPARVRVSRRGLSGLTSPVVAGNERTSVFATFRDAERFVSDGAGCPKGETTRARRGDGRNGNGNPARRQLKVHSPVEPRVARVVSAAKQPPRRRLSCFGRRPGRLGRKVSTDFGPVRKYFSPNVFGGLVKIRDKLSLKIRDKGG